MIGNCLEAMRGMGPNSVDAIVTDPPYGLEFMGKEWDKLWAKGDGNKQNLPGRTTGTHPYLQSHVEKYIAGKPMQGWHYAWAVEALRVAKPGAHLLAFGGTRTFHRLTCALEDAGWEIRDCLGWFYGSGFPKSRNVALDYEQKLCDYIDKKWLYKSDGLPMRRELPFRSELANQWAGFGTALKPAWEPIILARKPLCGTVAENVQKWGTGSINVDGCRVAHGEVCRPMTAQSEPGKFYRQAGRRDDVLELKPQGRWPANLIHDGSEEVLAGFPDTKSGAKHGVYDGWGHGREIYGDTRPYLHHNEASSGSAARFFYCAKASRAGREMGLEGMEPAQRDDSRKEGNPGWDNPRNRGVHKVKNFHPTVKPLALMRYLCRLIAPPNGLILDPFMGSGTTGMAAKAEGFRFIGIELDPDYHEIAERRIAHMESLPIQAGLQPGGYDEMALE